MSIDHMRQISQAEADAAGLRKEAQAEAKRIQDAGRKEAAALLEGARREAEEAYRKVIAEAEAEAEKAYEDRLQAVQKECGAMRGLAQGHKEEAVKLIIGKVVGASGNS